MLLLLAVGLALDWKWLRGTEEYRWRYYPLPAIEQRLWLTILCCFAVVIVCLWLVTWVERQRPLRFQIWILTGLLFLSAFGVQLALLYLEHPDPVATLLYRTVSTRNLGAFFVDASSIGDIGERLHHFPELMPHFESLSPRTHPPGLQVLFWGTAQLLHRFPEAADQISVALRIYLCNDPAASPVFGLANSVLASSVVQLAMPIWGALTVIPFFALSRRLFDLKTAVRGTILLIFAPSLVLFAAHWAHFYALIAITGVYILHRGLESRRWWPLLVAGFLVSAISFLSFSNLAVAALFIVYSGIYWLLAARSAPLPWQQYLRVNLGLILSQFVAFVVGLFSIWLLYYYFYGVDIIEVYRQGLATHTEITGYRTYWIWLGYNLYDFFLFLGLPALLAFILMLIRQFSPRIGEARFAPQTLPFWVFGSTLLALNLSGITRAEVARLWMFLIPMAILAVLPLVASWTRTQFALLLSVLVIQLLLLGTFVRTIGSTNYPFYVPRETTTAVPLLSNTINAEFGVENPITLLGYDVGLKPEPSNLPTSNSLDLTLYWQANQGMAHPYTVFVHVVDKETGALVAQHDSMPRNDALPTTCWQRNEIVSDQHLIPIDSTLPTGEYLLYVGLYQLDLLLAGDPNHRLPISWNGQSTTALQLTNLNEIFE